MSDPIILLLTWLALALHVLVMLPGVRRLTSLPLLPLLNLAVALCVLAYWIPRWYSYFFQGIRWYATDQLLPLYAVVVCVLAGLTLSGRYAGTVPHWMVLAIDALVLLAAALFFTFFRMDRLI